MPKRELTAQQIQFLKKFLNASISPDLVDYYSGIDYYNQQVGGNVSKFVERLANEGYIRFQGDSSQGWSCTAKGAETCAIIVNMARADETYSLEATNVLCTSEMLKVATELKKDGNLSAAILVLQNAYAKSQALNENLGVDVYLRLPAYLQKAGKLDEAWKILNNYLAQGIPCQGNSPGLDALSNSKVYKAMCKLQNERQGANESIVFGAACIACHLQYLYLQSTDINMPVDSRRWCEEVFRKNSKPEVLRQELGKLVGKNADNELLNATVSCLSSVTFSRKQLDVGRLIAEVNVILHG